MDSQDVVGVRLAVHAFLAEFLYEQVVEDGAHLVAAALADLGDGLGHCLVERRAV